MTHMNRRVLLVDDQADFLAGVRQLLAPFFEVSVVQSGSEALQRCEREAPFAAVVSDFAMPGMTGIELLRELRERWPQTTRLLLTGCADLGLALEALEQGAIFRFLTKPPAPGRLLEAVTAGVERFRAAEETRLFTEQLLFAQESLRSLHLTLERRLQRALGNLEALERQAQGLERATSLEEILAETSAAVRGVLGARVTTVEFRDEGRGLELIPDGASSQGERGTLHVLSSSARLAAENLQRRGQCLEAQRSTLRALESLARYRDDETGEHLARVSAYCRLLASALRADGGGTYPIDDEFIEHVTWAAPLHDIGKVAIPDAILFKPGKLDEREWEIMRTHAAIGAEILRGALESGQASQPQTHEKALRMAHDLAWTHHERWDGKGYPRALAGESIPLVGRIMSLADCYDALTSERPYKHAWSHAEALAYVHEQRGQAFDPALVDSFLARADEVEAVLRHSRAEPNAAH